MNRRIEELIKELGIRKVDFARKLNLSQPFISELCSGKTAPSDRTITDICREYNVNEQWLRTGEGEMFVPESRDEQIMAFVGKAMRGEESNFQRRLLGLLARLTVEEWELLHAKMRELMEEE